MPILCKWFGCTSAIISSVGQYFKHIFWFSSLSLMKWCCTLICLVQNGVQDLCKCYSSLIVTHDKCRSILHKSHICQKLPKPSRFLNTIASSHVLCLRCGLYNGWLFLVFPQNDSNDNKKHISCDGSPVVYVFRPIRIAKASQNNILASEA